uniref:Uncharacterized protein n=1 Tax=Mycena chlorophos TaxID=658473 RepID=A0ABQ0KUH2_MYCCL|nr:predicted protein [Mycena chlorophos]
MSSASTPNTPLSDNTNNQPPGRQPPSRANGAGSVPPKPRKKVSGAGGRGKDTPQNAPNAPQNASKTPQNTPNPAHNASEDVAMQPAGADERALFERLIAKYGALGITTMLQQVNNGPETTTGPSDASSNIGLTPSSASSLSNGVPARADTASSLNNATPARSNASASTAAHHAPTTTENAGNTDRVPIPDTVNPKKGISIQMALGMTNKGKEYNAYISGVRDLAKHAGLNRLLPLSEQDDAAVLLVCQAAREQFSRLARCPKDWGTKRILAQYLKNQCAAAVRRGQKKRNPRYDHLVANSAKRDPHASRTKLVKTYRERRAAAKAAAAAPGRQRAPVARQEFVQGSSRDNQEDHMDEDEPTNEWDARPTFDKNYVPADSDAEMNDDPDADQDVEEGDD